MDSQSYGSLDARFKNNECINSYMTYIVNLDAYELHRENEKSSTTLLMNAKVLNYTYDRGSFVFKSICILILMTIYICEFHMYK